MPETTVVDLGDALYLQCNLCTPPKPKFFVVVQIEPLRMLLINSQVNHYLWSRPNSRALHLHLHQTDHAEFLHHDSYLACDHLSHEYSLDKVSKLLATDPKIKRGRLHDKVRPLVAAAFVTNDQVPRKYLKELRPLWEAWLA